MPDVQVGERLLAVPVSVDAGDGHERRLVLRRGVAGVRFDVERWYQQGYFGADPGFPSFEVTDPSSVQVSTILLGDAQLRRADDGTGD